MTSNTCTFTDMVALAQFVAELTRQGIAFTVAPMATDGYYTVTITGY
jgi:hypothetical protein